MALIEDENPDLWLNFLRDRVPHDQAISSVAFEAYNAICLFEAKKPIDHVIPYLLTRACENDEDKMVALREGDKIALVGIKDGLLQIGNIFEASTKEQALYWVLRTYELIQLDPQAPLYLRCGEGTRKLFQAHLNIVQID